MSKIYETADEQHATYVLYASRLDSSTYRLYTDIYLQQEATIEDAVKCIVTGGICFSTAPSNCFSISSLILNRSYDQGTHSTCFFIFASTIGNPELACVEIYNESHNIWSVDIDYDTVINELIKRGVVQDD